MLLERDADVDEKIVPLELPAEGEPPRRVENIYLEEAARSAFRDPAKAEVGETRDEPSSGIAGAAPAKMPVSEPAGVADEPKPQSTADSSTATEPSKAVPVSVEPSKPLEKLESPTTEPPSESTPKAESKPTSVTAATQGQWTVQLGSFGNEQNALALAARLRQQSISADISQVVINGRTLYRVRSGSFPSREAATRQQVEIQSKLGLNGRVVPDS